MSYQDHISVAQIPTYLLLVITIDDVVRRSASNQFNKYFLCKINVMCMCLLVFCQLDTVRVIWEEVTPVEKMPPSNWLVGKTVEHFLISD